MTYVGELGWELYVPADVAAGAYGLLMDAGSAYGIVPAGYNAINALRLEKGYRAFGAELGPDVNPVEAGLLFATKLRSDTPLPSVARHSEKVRATGPLRRVVSLVLADPEVTLWGRNRLARRCGCGQVTSAAYGAAVGAAVGLASVWRRDGSRSRSTTCGLGPGRSTSRDASCRARCRCRCPSTPPGSASTADRPGWT